MKARVLSWKIEGHPLWGARPVVHFPLEGEFRIPKGEPLDDIVLTGPSGCGMTTALRSLDRTLRGFVMDGRHTCQARVTRDDDPKGRFYETGTNGLGPAFHVTFLTEDRNFEREQGYTLTAAIANQAHHNPAILDRLNAFWRASGPYGWPRDDGWPATLTGTATWRATGRHTLILEREVRGKVVTVQGDALASHERDGLELAAPFLTAFQAPHIVIIDKPELYCGTMRGNSPAYWRVKALRELAPDAQFIVGTNDEEFLSRVYQFEQFDMADLCFTDEELRARAARRMEERRND